MANVSSFSGAMPVIPGGLVELGYSQITSNVTITSNTAGSGTEIIAPLTVVCDGSPVLVEFWCGQTIMAASSTISLSLYRDGAEVHRQWAVAFNGSTTAADYPLMCASFRTTPSAGSHTFGVKAYGPSSPQMMATGTNNAPIFLRVSKIVSQNDGLKPFWKPPIVTQLPTLAQVGDQVVYAADATNGVYWLLQYDGLGTYPWKFIGGAPLLGYVASVGRQTTTATWQNLSGPSATIPLAGDYDLAIEAGYNDANTATYLLGIYNGASILRNARIYNTAYGGGEAFLTHRATAVTAATVIRPQYWVGVAQAVGYGWGESTVAATPIRVKAA